MTIDDEFAALMQDVTFDTDVPDPVTELDNLALVERSNAVRKELNALGELYALNPSSDKARALHSERNALTLELRRRGLSL